MQFSAINGLYEACWFFSGMFLYRMVLSFLNVGYHSLMIKTITDDGLTLARTLVQEVEILLEIKNDIMKDSDFPDEYITTANKLDQNMVSNWKSSLVQKINHAVPGKFKASMEFSSWSEAMQYLRGGKK